MPHPWLVMGGVLLVKKAVGTGAYFAAKKYGFARLYRRILEQNKRITRADLQPSVRTTVAAAFRVPGQIADVLAARGKEVDKLLADLQESNFAKSTSIIPGVSLASLASVVRLLPVAAFQGLVKEFQKEATAHAKEGSKPKTSYGSSSGGTSGSNEPPLR